MDTNTADRSENPAAPGVGSGDLLCLFAGHCYYPRGGAEDFRAIGTMDQLKELYAKNADQWSEEEGGYPDAWGNIADMKTMRILCHTWGKKGWINGAWSNR